jgi:multiple sugar transport system permease protein
MMVKTKKNLYRTLWSVFASAVLVVIYIYLVGPFLIMISNSFKELQEIITSQPTLIPKKPTLASFNEIFTDRIFMIDLFNSIKIGLITMVLAVILATPTAYAMARFKNKLTSGMVVWILLSQMVPGIITIVPIYNLLKFFSLTNTHAGLIVCYVVGSLPFSCWMMMGFVEGVPRELEEAAEIDGCGMIRMFVQILIPIILPGILTAGVFAFIAAWNELFSALCLMKTPALQTLPIRLQSFIGISGQARHGMLAAGCFISTIPGIIVFMIFQRFFVKGLTSGSIK